MNKPKILIAEDDPKTAELVRLYLDKNGYQVMVARDGRSALELARTRHPDLIVLDLMLPQVDGLDICRILRAEAQQTPGTPIIMLTARSTEDDKLLGLDLGADDYITKPFSPRELVARVRAVLRRHAPNLENEPDEIQVEGLQINFVRHEVQLNGRFLTLTPKEFKLLTILIKEPERAFTRVELMEKAFGYDYDGLERTVDVHLMNLRRKIESDPSQPKYIQTVYGVGYKFSLPDALGMPDIVTR